MTFRIFHRCVTQSTNLDARVGSPGDVFTADEQRAGRGRLDHRWLSPPRENLMMSVVLPVVGLGPEHVATLPLVVGVVVCRAVRGFLPQDVVRLKWPNDVLVEGRKVCGILCERQGDAVIAGIGVNVRQERFPAEIANRATSLVCAGASRATCTIEAVRDAILRELDAVFALWQESGLAPFRAELDALDCLKGRFVAIRQTDSDSAPIRGRAGGIAPDGTLRVGETFVSAGEAHVENVE